MNGRHNTPTASQLPNTILSQGDKEITKVSLNPKPFSSKYITYGLMYEPIALQQYEKFMFNRKTPVAVLKSGFVVSKSCPVLGASPDAKVFDFGCSLCFELAVVKCPHTKFLVTPLEPCCDRTFFMEKVSDMECKLKRDHPYYAQVQGQLGVTGAKWCDFMRILEREFTLREYHLMQPIG